MGAIFKVLNSFMGLLAIITCLAAVCIIAYSIIRPDLSRFGIGPGTGIVIGDEEEPGAPSESPDATPGDEEEPDDHQHEFTSVVIEEATCLEGGRLKHYCECGDVNYEKVPAIGHKVGEWQNTTLPTTTLTGERVKYCTICNDITEREVLPLIVEVTADPTPSPHVHNYVASIQSEPTCTVAGVRIYNCACGSFYQEGISAIGHLAADWTISVQATTARPGFRQRTCTVCHTLLDSQQIPQLPISGSSPSPSPTGGATPSPGTSPSPATSPSPSPTPHTHAQVSYESKKPTCVTQGSTTINCSIPGCGYEHITPIPINKNNHDFNANGTCRLCGAIRSASPSPSP